MFTANFLKSAFNCPGNRRQVVTPDIVHCISILDKSDFQKLNTYGDQMVQIGVVGWLVLQSMETNVVQSFVVKAISHIRVFNQLVRGEHCIVGFNHHIWHLWTKPPKVVSINWTFKKFTLADGNTLKVLRIRSGYSSFSLYVSSVPIPDPVPPPERFKKRWPSKVRILLQKTCQEIEQFEIPEDNRKALLLSCRYPRPGQWALRLLYSDPWPNYCLEDYRQPKNRK